MQNISTSLKTYFNYFTSYGYTVLDCTQKTIIDLFPNNSYCEMRCYNKQDDIYENALEIQIDKCTLLCYFDEAGRCNICYVFFDSTDEVDAYIKLYNALFDYCPTSKTWRLCSCFIKYFEEKDDRYFGYFAQRT